MTDKTIKNYGDDFTEEANIALQLLKQKGFEVPEGTEKELNCNWDLYFRAGYAAAVEAMEIEKKKKAEKKNKKFDIYDFVDLRKYKNNKSHHFLEGVYYDAENKKTVTTNGIYMVYSDSSIPEGYENKIVDKNGVFIDARFPNWSKVIPADRDIVETDAKKFAAAIHNTDVNMNNPSAHLLFWWRHITIRDDPRLVTLKTAWRYWRHKRNLKRHKSDAGNAELARLPKRSKNLEYCCRYMLAD